MSKPRTVNCPQCGAPVPWTLEAKWRPFCSQRCKLIDLGDWADERYRIPGTEPSQDQRDDAPEDDKH